MCVHVHTYMCMYVTRGAGQLPALRAALSTQISAAKVLAYGETSCCRDGKPSKQAEEGDADRRVPAGRDHIGRSVIVEVSHALAQGTGSGLGSLECPWFLSAGPRGPGDPGQVRGPLARRLQRLAPVHGAEQAVANSLGFSREAWPPLTGFVE